MTVDSLSFALKYYRGYRFKEWLVKLFDTGFNHGSDLVFLLGTPTDKEPGMTDNVDGAGKLLKAAEKECWIIRCKHSSPTREQQFFGVGGFGGKTQINKPENHRSPVEFGWEPNRNNKAAFEFAYDRPAKHLA